MAEPPRRPFPPHLRPVPSPADHAQLRLATTAGPDHVVVAVAGDVDAVTVREFADELMRRVPGPGRRMVVDLSELQFMATAAVHVLVAVNNRVMAGGDLLVLAGAQPVVARVLSLTGAGQVMPVVGSVAEALALA